MRVHACVSESWPTRVLAYVRHVRISAPPIFRMTFRLPALSRARARAYSALSPAIPFSLPPSSLSPPFMPLALPLDHRSLARAPFLS